MGLGPTAWSSSEHRRNSDRELLNSAVPISPYEK